MEQLPKIVQSRLQATAKPGVHPDPDLLAAFAERSLNPQEQSRMLEHLAHCADCREVLALAGVEAPQLQAAAATARSGGGWLHMPGLRWAGVAACVVVVGATALMLREQKAAKTPITEMVAVKQEEAQIGSVPPPAAEAKTAAPAATLRSEATRSETARSDTVAVDRDAPAKPQNAPVITEQPRRVVPDGRQDEHQLDALQQKTANEVMAATPSAPPPAPASAPAVSGSSGARMQPAGVTESVAVNAEEPVLAPMKDNSGNGQSSQTSAGNASTAEVSIGDMAARAKAVSAASGAAVGKAAEAGTRQTVKQAEAAYHHDPFLYSAAKANKARSSAALASTLQWTISPEGKLQRSSDSGKRWEAVPVADASTLRAVSALGQEVWAGGNGGVLYHSSDGGAHWTQVKPSFLGTPLTADITHIEFLDARHGRLITANQEIWATTDGGASWLKR